MPELKLYNSCYDLPLSRFIKCICDEDYLALIIEGEATPEALSEVWAKIYQEYIDLMGNTSNDYMLTLMMEVNRLYFRHESIVRAVELLRSYRFDELVSMLKKEGFNLQFNPNDADAYGNDLKKVTTRAKSLLVEMEQKKSQLDLLKQTKGSGSVTREFFDKILVTLSKFMGFKINKDKTTVTEYIYTLKDYINHCKALESKNVRGSHK